MTLALSTTTISVQRTDLTEDSETDPWERDDPDTPTEDESVPSQPEIIASEIPADIGFPVGRAGGPGQTETLEFPLACDPTDLTFRDTVVDEKTGQVYEVQWSTLVSGLPGFEHMVAGLKMVTGPGNE